MNPYENLDPNEEDKIESEDDDGDDLVPFEDQEELHDENFREGNVYNYSGNKDENFLRSLFSQLIQIAINKIIFKE